MPMDVIVSAQGLIKNNETIGFFGGEPLLFPKTIVNAMDVTLLMHDNVHFDLTTNGTTLTSMMMDLLSDYPLSIALSHDGSRHPNTRLTSDQRVIYADAAASLLLQYDPDSTAMTTYRPVDISYLKDDVGHLYRLGFKHICLNPDLHVCGYDIPHLESILMDILDDYADVDFIGMRKGFIRSDCKKELFVETDGKLFSCTSHANHSELCIGDVFTGVDEAQVERIRTAIPTIPSRCIGCPIAGRCMQKCSCIRLISTNSLGDVSDTVCEYERMMDRIRRR